MAGISNVFAVCLVVFSTLNSARCSYYCNHRWTTNTFYGTPTPTTFQAISLHGENGQDDLLVLDGNSPKKYWISESLATGTFDLRDDMEIGIYCTATGDKLYAADIDGDSRDDLLCNKADGSFSVRYYMNGKKFKDEENFGDGFRCVVALTSPVNKLMIGDFDGNNADDLMCISTAVASAAGSPILFNGACPKNFHYSANHNYHRAHNFQTIRRPSVHYRKQSHSHHGRGYTNNQCSKEFPKRYTLPTGALAGCDVTNGDKNLILGDANGDGRDDFMCHMSVGSSPHVIKTYFALGHTSGSIFSSLPISLSDTSICKPDDFEIHASDVDGDGDDDIVCVDRTVQATPVGSLEVSYFNNNQYGAWDSGVGNDCDPGDFCFGASVTTSPLHYIVGDFNRDGKDDFMCHYQEDASTMITEIVFAQ